MKIKRRFRIALVGLTAIGVLVGLTACHYSPTERANWIESKIASQLDLTAEQKTKLDAVKQAFLDIHKSHEADQAKHIEDVKQMILSDHLDAAKVKALIEQRQKFMDGNFDALFLKVAVFHDSLTPDQKKKAVEMVDKFVKQWM